MLRPDDEQKIAERMKVVYILYATFVVSIIIMTALPLSGNLQVPVKEPDSPIIQVLLAIGVINLALAEIVPKIIRRGGTPGDASGILSKFFISVIIGAALRESVAVFGLVSFMLTGLTQWPMIFGGAAVVAMLLGWPKSENLRRMLAG